MYDWNAPEGLPGFGVADTSDSGQPHQGDALSAIDCELEAAIEYKLAVCGIDGVAEIIELLNRSVRRRWVGVDFS